MVFEGMMDFLSALTLAGKEALCDDVLLLNSVGLKDSAQSFIQEKQYPTARLCLDHDLNAFLVNKQRQWPGR